MSAKPLRGAAWGISVDRGPNKGTFDVVAVSGQYRIEWLACSDGILGGHPYDSQAAAHAAGRWAVERIREMTGEEFDAALQAVS